MPAVAVQTAEVPAASIGSGARGGRACRGRGGRASGRPLRRFQGLAELGRQTTQA